MTKPSKYIDNYHFGDKKVKYTHYLLYENKNECRWTQEEGKRVGKKFE